MADISTTPAASDKVSGKVKPKRRRGRSLFNFLLFIAVIGALGLFAWAEQQRRDAIQKLEQTTKELEEIRKVTERTGAAVAQQVLENVRKHMDVPTDPDPTVATIIDIESLRKENPFYNKAENGDHLVITRERAILYDPDRNLILDVVPVQIQPPAEGEGTEGQPPAEGEEGAAAGEQAGPTPTVSPAATAQPTQSPTQAQASPTP